MCAQAYDVISNDSDFAIVMSASPFAPKNPRVAIELDGLRLIFDEGEIELEPLPAPYDEWLPLLRQLLVIETGPTRHAPYLAKLQGLEQRAA